MPPKRAGKPLSDKKATKVPRLINTPVTDANNVIVRMTTSQIQELERALEQNENHSRVLHLIREVAKTPNLAPILTTRLLKFCVKVGSEYVLRQLLDNQAIDVNTREGGELLWTAIDKGEDEIAAMLVRRGADLSVRKSNDNSTILHGALRSYEIKSNAKREELVGLMLNRDADVNARDGQGYSVLHDAIQKDHCSTELVEKLLERGAQVSAGIDTDMNDIFWASCYKMELLPRLVEHLVPDEETRNERGAMAIDSLMSKDSTGTKLADAVRMIKRILDLGVPADIDVLDEVRIGRRERSLLSTALFLKKKDVIKLLLDYGADPRRKNERGSTPLFQATAFKGYTHASRWLIEKGASIHDRNDDGCYPIHGACLHNSLRNIHLLLNLGANLNVTDNEGRTPFRYTDDTYKFNEAHALIIKHFALLIARGEKICDEDMTSANQYVWGNHHFKKCTKQLERMKVEYICDGVSYFSLLSKDMYSTLKLVKNQNFVRNFNGNLNRRDELFPEYSYMLLHSFEVAEKRLEVLLAEKEQLREVFPEAIPDHIVENIVYYFCFDKLERCQYDYYMSLHANLKNTEADKAKIR